MTEKDYKECVTDHADRVYRFILKNIRHEEDAGDIVQTSFEKLWKNRHEVEAGKCRPYPYAVGIRLSNW